MALIKILLGLFPNDKTGDKLRAGGQKINTAFDQIDTNETDIATNAASIVTNAAAIKLIQSKSFRSPSTAPITNSSSTVYVATDLIIAITPKSASSKLYITAVLPMEAPDANQTGVKVIIQKKVGAGAWTDILYGNQTDTVIYRDPTAIGINSRMPIVAITDIDSPGISDEIQFRATFAPFVNAIQVVYSDDKGMRSIKVQEILED